MISLLPLAFVAGVLTVAAPCLLPVLPVVLGGSLSASKWRPLGIAAGLVVAFTIFGTGFAIFLDVLGISKGTLRTTSIVLLFLFGLALAVPTLWEWMVVNVTFAWRTIIHNPPQPSPGLRPPSPRGRGEGEGHAERGLRKGNGFWSAFGIGATLGIIWTPCAGPILGAVLTFAATTRNIFQSGVLFFVYGLGAALPMLLIGYGSRALVLRIKNFAHASALIQRVAGIILMAWAVALWFGLDRYMQALLMPLFPVQKL